jgi:hypothetical protein
MVKRKKVISIFHRKMSKFSGSTRSLYWKSDEERLDMRMMKIVLWYHDEDGGWSVEIGGTLHSHISESNVDELVEYALVTLTEQEARSLGLSDRTAKKVP